MTKTPTDKALEIVVALLIANGSRLRQREGRLEEVRFWTAVQKFAIEREYEARNELDEKQAKLRRETGRKKCGCPK